MSIMRSVHRHSSRQEERRSITCRQPRRRIDLSSSANIGDGEKKERATEVKRLVGVGKSDVLFGFVGITGLHMLPSSNRERYIYKQNFVSNP